MTPNIAKLKVIYGLDRLSDPVRSDVLSDGSIARRFDIPLTRPIQLTDDLIVDRQALFSAFRAAADGVSIASLMDRRGEKFDAKVYIETDHAGIFEIDLRRIRFAHAGLLASDAERRISILCHLLVKHSLAASHVESLTTIVSQIDFSNEDFFRAARSLSASPESFSRIFRGTLEKGQISMADLIPDDSRHWENITAVRLSSITLQDFIADELARERRARIARDAVHGFLSVSLTFAAPALIPYDVVEEMDSDTLLRVLTAAESMEDHFALGGAFEICATRVAKDPRFEGVGSNLLERLLGDMDRLQTGCGIFAAAFIASSARLAVHETTRDQPAFWRRLAAASHASLVVRTSGVTDVEQDRLIRWAMRFGGHEYLFSSLRDMATDPQWRPEWADPRFLTADIFGRAYAAVLRLDSGAPKAWQERIEKAKEWIEAHELGFFVPFPAVLEGARRPRSPALSELSAPAAEAFRRMSDEPSIENFIQIGPLVQLFGIPVDLQLNASAAVQQMKSSSLDINDKQVQAALTLASHIAVLTNDIALGELVAETCLEKARTLGEEGGVCDIVCRLVECAAANMDQTKGRLALAGWLESLAFILSVPSQGWRLAVMIESLKQVDHAIAPMLGRAQWVANLAGARKAAA